MDKSIIDKARSLSAGKIGAALESITVGHCIACNATDLRIMAAPDGSDSPGIFSLEVYESDAFIPYFVITCGECGFLMNFRLARVMEVLDGMPEGQLEGEGNE